MPQKCINFFSKDVTQNDVVLASTTLQPAFPQMLGLQVLNGVQCVLLPFSLRNQNLREEVYETGLSLTVSYYPVPQCSVKIARYCYFADKGNCVFCLHIVLSCTGLNYAAARLEHKVLGWRSG